MFSMIIKNLWRRKGRTILTVLGISIGVAAIIALGALSSGFSEGYTDLLSGSKADLVISQPNSMDISMSSVDMEIGEKLEAMPEVHDISGMLEGFVQTEGAPYFFVFGYPKDSFVLDRFQIIEGLGLNSPKAKAARGTPLILGSAAAESFNKTAGDSLRLGNHTYRIIGVYETGDAFEDGGAVLLMEEAQELLGKPRQVNLYYIQLKDPALEDRFRTRVERIWSDLSLATTDEFADNQIIDDYLGGFTWVIAGLAIIIGGIGMMNTQLMSVVERTREIGVLKALGWTNNKVMRLILGESLVVCFLGGAVGVLIGWLILVVFSDSLSFFGASSSSIGSGQLVQVFFVVIILGLVAGLYPARRASRLEPIEAIRYEGGTSGEDVKRVPFGGMAMQSLRQRSGRSLLAMSAIAITVGAIMALQAVINGTTELVNNMGVASDAQIMIRQADIADTSLSALDERIGEQIAALEDVEYINGMSFTATMLTDPVGFFILTGYEPSSYAIQNYEIVEGERIKGNRQIMVGKLMADTMNWEVGETIDLAGTRFKIVGIFTANTGWEEVGGIATLRDVQAFGGRPRKVMLFMVKVHDAENAPLVVEEINRRFPDAHATLTSEFADAMPDMEAADAMLGGISFLAILIGGLGVMNTMLMAVLERTREIGVLRALGWRRNAVLSLIMRESLLLGLLGGVLGLPIALLLAYSMKLMELYADILDPIWTPDIFVRAILVAVFLGLVGGISPAFRATRLEPVEAFSYE